MDLDKNTTIGIAYLQLHDQRLRLPFGFFHKCVEKALNRPVYTHEFGLGYGYESILEQIEKVFKEMVKQQKTVKSLIK